MCIGFRFKLQYLHVPSVLFAMKKLLLLAFILIQLFAVGNAAAGSEIRGANTLLFIRNHWSIESGFTVLRVTPLTETGQGNMALSHRPGMFLGFKYHINLSNHFSIRIGPTLGLHGFRYDFDPGSNGTIVYEPVLLSVAKLYLLIPLELNTRLMVKRRHLLGLIAGVSVSVYTTEKITANTSLANNPLGQEVYSLQLAYQKPNTFINVIAGIEYARVLKSMDLVTFSIKYSAGFRPLFEAYYSHKENDLVMSSGSFTSYNDFVCLSIGYVFTRVNKLHDK